MTGKECLPEIENTANSDYANQATEPPGGVPGLVFNVTLAHFFKCGFQRWISSGKKVDGGLVMSQGRRKLRLAI